MTEATKTKATEIARWLDSEPGPRSRMAIQWGVRGNALLVRAAINALLTEPSSGIVEVGPKERGAFKVWTRAAAERAGLHVREPAAAAELEIDGSAAAASETGEADRDINPEIAVEASPPVETTEDAWGYADGWCYSY
jgi:hypothetical protein